MAVFYLIKSLETERGYFKMSDNNNNKDLIVLSITNTSPPSDKSEVGQWRCPNCSTINDWHGLSECSSCPGKLMITLGGGMMVGLVISRHSLRGTLLVMPGHGDSLGN